MEKNIQTKKEKNIAKLYNKMQSFDLMLSSQQEKSEQTQDEYKAVVIDSKEAYKNKKKLMRKKIIIEKKIISLKSKISWTELCLKSLHLSNNHKYRNIGAKAFNKILIEYENDTIKNEYFNWYRLSQILINYGYLAQKQFNLETYNAIKNKTFLFKTKNKNVDKNIELKIKKCENTIRRLIEKDQYIQQSFKEAWHAGLVKKLDKLSHKKSKNPVTETDPGKYVINLKSTSKYYYNKYLAVKVLKNIDLQIKHGEFIVILGPSGSGKTTLLNIISGMDTATYGETFVEEQNLIYKNSNALTKFRRDYIGYIFQQYGLLPNLNVKENIEIGQHLQKNKDKRIEIDELLKTVGMYDHRNKFPSELSGGQQQRVSVARSLAKNPNIIFGDEPTGAIDEAMSKQIMQLFLDINEKFKTTIIIVTHNPIFVGLASRVIKVKDGKIFEDYIVEKRKKIKELNWSI